MIAWEKNEAGWYTWRGVGGIVREEDGWYFYPLLGKRIGPFKTLAAAKIGAASEGRPQPGLKP